MQSSSINSIAMLKWMAPLVDLPENYRRQVFSLSTGWHIGIAALLNVLSLAVPIMMLQVYDRIIPHQAYGTLTLLIFGVLVALLFDAILRLARAWLTGWAAASNEHAAACAAVERFSRAQLDAFEQSSIGTHMQNFSALDRLREFYSGQSLTAMVDLPFAALFLLLIAYMGNWLVLVPTILLAVFVIFSQHAGIWLKNMIEARGKADDSKASYIISVLTGIHTAKAFGMEMPLLRRFEQRQKDVTEGSYGVALSSGFAATLSAAFSQLSLILTATVGSMMVINGHLSVGGLSACTMLAGRALQPVQRVLGTWLRLQDLEVSHGQADMLFAVPVQERKTEPLPPPRGSLNLQNVKFAYEKSAAPLFDGTSLGIEPGDTVAICGDKGSGKSTLLQIMAGVITPTEGTVELDGFNPAAYSMSAMRKHIGYLPQQGVMLKGSILDNITGFMNDEASIVAAKETARDLKLDAVVDVLARGYATFLTDSGADPIPPGVKQRVALARVLRHKPALLMFDDADKALDKEGYNRLFRVLGRLKGNCSIVMVSHDQNLLSFADRFYGLENGKLVQMSGSDVQKLSLLAAPSMEARA
jgi:ATP-binding cassette subfamily C protein LapB